MSLEEKEPMATTLKPTVKTPHEKALALTTTSRSERDQAEGVHKILSLSGVSKEEKLRMISKLDEPGKNPTDNLDALTGKFNFKTDETSTAAYGDDKALVQYNALLNVQLPPFYGNSLEFTKWW